MASGKFDKRIKEILNSCVDDGGCLVWQGYCTPSGLPQGSINGSNALSLRRVIYESARGKISSKTIVVSMKCGCTACLNPDHMVTKNKRTVYKENGRQDTIAKRLVVTKARRERSKVTWDMVDYIRNSDDSASDAATKLGISKCSVYHIRAFNTWKPVANNPFAGLMK